MFGNALWVCSFTCCGNLHLQPTCLHADYLTCHSCAVLLLPAGLAATFRAPTPLPCPHYPVPILHGKAAASCVTAASLFIAALLDPGTLHNVHYSLQCYIHVMFQGNSKPKRLGWSLRVCNLVHCCL